jgi:hypothetical protein
MERPILSGPLAVSVKALLSRWQYFQCILSTSQGILFTSLGPLRHRIFGGLTTMRPSMTAIGYAPTATRIG